MNGDTELEQFINDDEKELGVEVDSLNNHHYQQAGFFSKAFFGWMFPLLKSGFKKPLEMEDLYDMPEHMTVDQSASDFERVWDGVVRETRSSFSSIFDEYYTQGESSIILWKTLFSLHWRSILSMNVLMTFSKIATLINAYLLMVFIEYMYLPKDEAPIITGIGYAVAITICTVASSFGWQHGWAVAMETGIKIRNGISTAIYRKTLRLNNLSKGDVVTRMSVDPWRPAVALNNAFWIWLSPATLLVCIIMIAALVGWATVPAVIIMVILSPINYLASKKFESIEDQMMAIQQDRVKQVGEVLQGILVVKLFAWEEYLSDKIKVTRGKEVGFVRTFAYLLATIMSMITGASTLMSLATFSMFVILGNDLSPQIIFPCIYLFGVAQWPLIDWPFAISNAARGNTSAKRLQEYLLREEINPTDQSVTHDVGVTISNGTFQWSGSSTPALTDVSVNVPADRLVAIVGPVGAGKSTLLSGVLGEVKRNAGDVSVSGKIAYVPQQAWIRNATLKDNILCASDVVESEEEREVRYQEVLDTCGLKTDIDILPGGDATEIGERGINLSGGQKQRINLARAVFSDADIYLLDDPLSAVDAHVGHHLFEQCIKGKLSGKCRLLVTHQLQFLPYVDEIWVLDSGRITHRGSYLELTTAGVSFASLIENEESEDTSLLNSTLGSSTTSLRNSSGSHRFIFSASQDALSFDVRLSDNEEEEAVSPVTKKNEPKSEQEVDTTLIEEEERYTGAVGSDVYVQYLKHFGGILFVTVFSFLSLSYEIADALNKVWLSKWSSDYYDQVDVWVGLGIFLGLGIFATIVMTVRHYLWFGCAATASEKIHNRMLSAVLRAPMSFFHSTPQGRILNRFSKDQSAIDQDLPDLVSDCLLCLAEITNKVIVITVGVPLFIFLWIPVGAIYILVQQFYRRSSCELKRLDSISNSPIFAHFSETLDGLSTIRAYRLQESEIQENTKRISINCKAAFCDRFAARWLGSAIALVGTIISLSVCVLGVFCKWFNIMDVSLAALSISYSMDLNGTMNWLVRCFTQTEAEMSKVERMLHYCGLPPEAPDIIEETAPPSNWPVEGSIEFHELEMRYRPELPPVIKSLTFEIAHGEKIGVCGRTGAGKSSLMMSLFRIVEASSGSIIVDGLNIASLGLTQLRSSLSIIPQDPVLFSGTIRSNLDASEQTSDFELWSVLDRVNLKAYIESLPLKLDNEVKENGSNLSVGQRQLICLGRALLKQTTILIMDEATASVDAESDALIQETVREAFADRTVLTIAHRLPTIIDADRIIVLDRGEIVEFDHPHLLLKKKDGHLSRLVADTGADSERYLRKMARTAFKSRSQQNLAVSEEGDEGEGEATNTDPAEVLINLNDA